MNHTIPDEDETFPGYTDDEANAIHQALIAVGLKPDADFHGKILFSIVQVVDAVSGGGAHPHNVLYESGIQDDLTALLAKVDAAVKQYDQLVDVLQAHVEAQCQPSVSGLEGIGDTNWASSIELARAASDYAGQHVCPIRVPARHNFRQLLTGAAAIVRQAQEQPLNPMLAPVQKLGTPKNYALRLVVTKLLEIFEQATEIEPTVYASQDSEDGYKGKFYPFAIACLAPVNLVPRKQLGSNVLTVYREWKAFRGGPMPGPSNAWQE